MGIMFVMGKRVAESLGWRSPRPAAQLPEARAVCVRPLTCFALVTCAALFGTGASQRSESRSGHYTIVTTDGSNDLDFARRWLSAAERLMATKYHVVPDRYHVSVYLLLRPKNDIDTTQSGQNRCCGSDAQGRRTGTIFLLGPSASVWRERALVSSLGLPKDGEDYHAKVLMAEYMPIGHLAVQDRRAAGGWQYYSAPQWFIQGLQEYDAIFHSTEINRTQTAAALVKWARQNELRFACCANGLELVDAYNGGAAFMVFLAAQFGESVHERILRNGARTFDEALAAETTPFSQTRLFEQFRAWVRASR
jgi:hypothetical protein